ncbi:HNH endonuclease signature motif containing protein [Streptomyces longwoodensis]|uniref:HNH endonuclease signature motif containing protein n=1 Tax=Streptomyces longwoodensis TaxID=68231 RepID=UPI0033FD278D
MPRERLTREARFWAKVALPSTPDGCLIWTAHLTSSGYGGFTGPGRRNARAHRYAYEMLVGPVPDGLQLDHLCKERRCVRPDHLEPVTLVENVMRGESVAAQNAQRTHCKRGHALSGENLYRKPDGRRVCRSCRRARERNLTPAPRLAHNAYHREWKRKRKDSE